MALKKAMNQDTTKETPDKKDKVNRETSRWEQLHAGYQTVTQEGNIGRHRKSYKIEQLRSLESF